MRDLRVLVVDDVIDFRILLRIQLSMIPGVKVVGTAGDGLEALRAVDADPPDVVVMDLLMPGMDGFEAIDHLRARRPEVAIVAYTAVAARDTVERVAEKDVELVVKSGGESSLVEAMFRATGRDQPA